MEKSCSYPNTTCSVSGVSGNQISRTQANYVSGTTEARSTSAKAPSRSTVAVGATVARRRSTARCERNVCAKFIATLSETMTMLMVALTSSPTNADTMLANSRMATSGLANCRSNSSSRERRFVGAGSLGPYRASRRAASAESRPTFDDLVGITQLTFGLRSTRRERYRSDHAHEARGIGREELCAIDRGRFFRGARAECATVEKRYRSHPCARSR